MLGTYGDPRKLVVAGIDALTAFVAQVSHGMYGQEKAEGYLEAARQALALYGDDDAVPYTALAAALATEIGLLRAMEEALAAHEQRREQLYGHVDPAGSLVPCRGSARWEDRSPWP